MQVRTRSRVSDYIQTIKLQEGQRGKAEKTQKIKTAPENPTGTKATYHEKGKKKGSLQ